MDDDHRHKEANPNQGCDRACYPPREAVPTECQRHSCDKFDQLPPARTTYRSTSALVSCPAFSPPPPARISPGMRNVNQSVAAPIRNGSHVTSGSSRKTAVMSKPPSFSATTWTN